MIAFVFLIITLLSVPVTMFQALEEQDTRQDAAITSVGIAADDPCALPDDSDDAGDEENDTPSDDNGSDDGDDESPEDTDSPDEDNGDSDNPDDGDSDTPDDNTDDTPRTRTPRVRDPERTQRKLAREIRKRVNQKRPSITVTVPTPNIRKPNIPTPRPPRQPLIQVPTFDDLFGRNEEEEEDLGEQIQKKVKSRFESKGPAPTSIVNRVRPTSPVTKRVRPTSPVARKEQKETRRTVQAPRTQVPVVSQALRQHKGSAKNTRQTVRDRLKNNKVRIQQAEDCITPAPDEESRTPLNEPKKITVTVKGAGGTLIPGADVWFNDGDDKSCRTTVNGKCTKEVYYSGEYTISASKEGYDTTSGHTVTMKDFDISTTITLYKKGQTPSDESTTQKTYDVLIQVSRFRGQLDVPNATVRILKGGVLIHECTSDTQGNCGTKLEATTYQLEVLHPELKPLFQEIAVQAKSGQQIFPAYMESQDSSSENPPSNPTASFNVTISAYVEGQSKASVVGTRLIIARNGTTVKDCTIPQAAISCRLQLQRGTYDVTATHPNYEGSSTQITVVGKENATDRYYETFSVYLRPQNTSGIRAVSVLDYNSLISCYSDRENPKSCSAEQKKKVDLNRDGKVNQLDYNMFISNLRL